MPGRMSGIGSTEFWLAGRPITAMARVTRPIGPWTILCSDEFDIFSGAATMSSNTASPGVLFKEIADRPLTVRFDQEHSSSDGGSLLLKALDQRPGLSSALSACLRDGRQVSKVPHDLQTLLRQCRVIIKASIALHPGRSPKYNPRFVVTNLKGDPQRIYEQIYCARGDAENRIKELKDGLQIDQTSCTSFHANQFRVLITAAAYELLQELRLQARDTSCAKAQVSTLCLRLLKRRAWVERSVRRIVIHLPMHRPHAQAWHRIARSVGAIPT